VTPLALVRDVLARIVVCREAVAVGDILYVEALLRDLEDDVAGWVAREDERRAA
jgi:hypothetical protein